MCPSRSALPEPSRTASGERRELQPTAHGLSRKRASAASRPHSAFGSTNLRGAFVLSILEQLQSRLRRRSTALGVAIALSAGQLPRSAEASCWNAPIGSCMCAPGWGEDCPPTVTRFAGAKPVLNSVGSGLVPVYDLEPPAMGRYYFGVKGFAVVGTDSVAFAPALAESNLANGDMSDLTQLIDIAAAQWTWRTGADVGFERDKCSFGAGADCIQQDFGCDQPQNGMSGLQFVKGVLPNGQMTQITFSCCNPTGVASEADICIASEAATGVPFRFGASAHLGPGEIDLVGVLVNAFGRVLGLAPQFATVMAPQGSPQSLSRRNPTGADVTALREKYGVRDGVGLQARILAESAITWGSESTIGMESLLAPAVAIGRGPAAATGHLTGFVVLVFVGTGPFEDEVGIARSALPGPSENQPLSFAALPCQMLTNQDPTTCKSHAAPAIAASAIANPPQWAAAWTKPRSHTTSPCVIVLKRSTDAFATFGGETLVNICTFDPPALAYDEGTHQFVLAATRQDGRIALRLSADGGATWNPSDLETDLYAFGSPSVSCGLPTFGLGIGECVIAAAEGDRRGNSSAFNYAPLVMNIALWLVPNWSPFSQNLESSVAIGEKGYPLAIGQLSPDDFGQDRMIAARAPATAVRRREFGNSWMLSFLKQNSSEETIKGGGRARSIEVSRADMLPPLGGQMGGETWGLQSMPEAAPPHEDVAVATPVAIAASPLSTRAVAVYGR